MQRYESLPLRADEEVIEEFGVSNKYTYLLLGIGLVILGIGILSLLYNDPIIDFIAAGAGPLAPAVFVFISIALFVVSFAVGGIGIYLRLAYRFYLTNQRILERVGLLGQQTISADYPEITEVIVRQDIFNRLLLNTGTLAVNTPGSAGVEFNLVNVDNPAARREILRHLVRAANQGVEIDRRFIAEVKAQTGMSASVEAALAELEKSTGDVSEPDILNEPEPRKQQISPVADPAPTIPDAPAAPETKPTPFITTSADEVEDLHGDGIDESDRLRAAQKHLGDQLKP